MGEYLLSPQGGICVEKAFPPLFFSPPRRGEEERVRHAPGATHMRPAGLKTRTPFSDSLLEIVF